jgi:hypothetical protein
MTGEHPGSWTPEVQKLLDGADSLENLTWAWGILEVQGAVDSIGFAERKGIRSCSVMRKVT